jgi:hypothetical protein
MLKIDSRARAFLIQVGTAYHPMIRFEINSHRVNWTRFACSMSIIDCFFLYDAYEAEQFILLFILLRPSFNIFYTKGIPSSHYKNNSQNCCY